MKITFDISPPRKDGEIVSAKIDGKRPVRAKSAGMAIGRLVMMYPQAFGVEMFWKDGKPFGPSLVVEQWKNQAALPAGADEATAKQE